MRLYKIEKIKLFMGVEYVCTCILYKHDHQFNPQKKITPEDHLICYSGQSRRIVGSK